jgi:hypothetical protein
MGGDYVASSVKLLYLGIFYRFIAEKTFYLEICVTLSKEFTNCSRFYHFIGAGKLFSGFFIASSVNKILANKIVSLYSIFFLKNCVLVSL